MRVILIAAVARNGVIGRDNDLPWRLPADLRHFKKKTLGHTLVMGRRTWESLPGLLPGRKTLVLSRSDPGVPEGVRVVGSFEEAVEVARDGGETELFVAGGAGVYAAGLQFADRMVLTHIEADFEGDTYFPKYEVCDWRESNRTDFSADSENRWPFSIVEYERVEPIAS